MFPLLLNRVQKDVLSGASFLYPLSEDHEEMSKPDGRSSPQTGKWKSKEFRAFQGRKSHSAVDPAPEKGIEQVDQAERRSCLAER